MAISEAQPIGAGIAHIPIATIGIKMIARGLVVDPLARSVIAKPAVEVDICKGRRVTAAHALIHRVGGDIARVA